MADKIKTLIISDIFGRTLPLENFTESLAVDCEIIDPYQGEYIRFTDESHAYGYFMDNIGITRYAESIKEKLALIHQPIDIIAFSVGASAIWQVSADLAKDNIKNITCFYGSQIRHQTDIKPNVPVKLIFPEMEVHFSVGELIARLQSKHDVELDHSCYLHGFMNELSGNFNRIGYLHYLERLKLL